MLFFFNFSIVWWHWKMKQFLAPKKKSNWRPWLGCRCLRWQQSRSLIICIIVYGLLVSLWIDVNMIIIIIRQRDSLAFCWCMFSSGTEYKCNTSKYDINAWQVRKLVLCGFDSYGVVKWQEYIVMYCSLSQIYIYILVEVYHLCSQFIL